MPSSSADEESARPSHQRPEGLASSAPHTSRVTSAADLLPAISGAYPIPASGMTPGIQDQPRRRKDAKKNNVISCLRVLVADHSRSPYAPCRTIFRYLTAGCVFR